MHLLDLQIGALGGEKMTETALGKLLTALITVNTYQLFAELLILGAVLGFVFFFWIKGGM